MTFDPVSQPSSSWTILLNSLQDAIQSEEINPSQIIQILSEYKSEEEDWSRYAYFDEKTYTRNLIDGGNGFYNLMALAWNPGQGSCIHDHAGCGCFVKVLAGAITEIRYETPEEGEKFSTIGEYRRQRDEVTFIEDSIGVHEMQNDTANQSVTLHLYVPPFDVCNRFDRGNATRRPCSMTFKSILGEVVEKEMQMTDNDGARPCC